MTALDIYIDSSSDDTQVYRERITNIWKLVLTGVTVDVGHGSIHLAGVGLRFNNVSVPVGATISNAYITINPWAVGGNASGTHSEISGNLSSNASTFSTIADYQARRGIDCGGANDSNRTSSIITWDDIPLYDQYDVVNTPDISSIIQEIIDLPGWTSGNSIALFWDDHADRTSQTVAFVVFRTIDWDVAQNPDTYYRPLLHIEYETHYKTRVFPTIYLGLKSSPSIKKTLIKTPFNSKLGFKTSDLTWVKSKVRVLRAYLGLNLNVFDRVTHILRKFAPSLKVTLPTNHAIIAFITGFITSLAIKASSFRVQRGHFFPLVIGLVQMRKGISKTVRFNNVLVMGLKGNTFFPYTFPFLFSLGRFDRVYKAKRAVSLMIGLVRQLKPRILNLSTIRLSITLSYKRTIKIFTKFKVVIAESFRFEKIAQIIKRISLFVALRFTKRPLKITLAPRRVSIALTLIRKIRLKLIVFRLSIVNSLTTMGRLLKTVRRFALSIKVTFLSGSDIEKWIKEFVLYIKILPRIKNVTLKVKLITAIAESLETFTRRYKVKRLFNPKIGLLKNLRPRAISTVRNFNKLLGVKIESFIRRIKARYAYSLLIGEVLRTTRRLKSRYRIPLVIEEAVVRTRLIEMKRRTNFLLGLKIARRKITLTPAIRRLSIILTDLTFTYNTMFVKTMRLFIDLIAQRNISFSMSTFRTHLRLALKSTPSLFPYIFPINFYSWDGPMLLYKAQRYMSPFIGIDSYQGRFRRKVDFVTSLILQAVRKDALETYIRSFIKPFGIIGIVTHLNKRIGSGGTVLNFIRRAVRLKPMEFESYQDEDID